MGISGVSASGYYQGQTTPSQNMPSQTAPVQDEENALVGVLEEEDRKTLTEMMKEAREQAEQREKMFQIPKNSRRYGDAAMTAYAKLARARSLGEVDAASGYARRQIARLRAAKGSDSENADRIQAAINQLQKAVNRAGRKKREISQEKTVAKRQVKLEKEKRLREAKRQRQELRRRQAQRMIRESGYIREAEVDNRLQNQLSAAKLELRSQMQEISSSTQAALDTAIQGYAAAGAEAAPVPEISVEA